MGNAILAGVGIFLILMTALGLKRGLIKTAFSFASVFVVLLLVNIFTPTVKDILKETPVYAEINKNIEQYVNENVTKATENMTQTGVGAQKKIIDGLPLPNSVKNSLEENNNQTSYDALQVDSFGEYIAAYVSDMVIEAVAFVLLFVVLTILIRVLLHVLDVVSRLPVIRTFNMAGGGIIGLLEAVVILWIACIIITIFSSTQWGQTVFRAISGNEFLSFIYDNNPIQKML